MKLNLLFPLLAGCLLAATSAAGQAPPVRTSGYWNLETNLTTHDYTVVRFYNQQHELVYTERLNNLCLDLSQGGRRCRRTARHLDAALQQLLRKPGLASQSPTLLAAEFGQNRWVQRAYASR